MMTDLRSLRLPDRPHVSAEAEIFAAEAPFEAAEIITVTIADGSHRGRGECVPDRQRGESVESVLAAIDSVAQSVETGMLTRRGLQRSMAPGAARNALDLALWNYDAKRTGTAVWQIAGLEPPHRVVTSVTLPLASPLEMAEAAAAHSHRPLLRLMLGAQGDMERLAAIRLAVPDCRLIVDAGAAWTAEQLEDYLPPLKEAGVELIERPLPDGADEALSSLRHLVPIAAPCRRAADIERIAELYDAVTITLDDAGGLSAALELIDAASEAHLRIMIGSRPGTALGTAPAVLLAQQADWTALDAPLRLRRDRQPGLRYDGSVLYPPRAGLWG